MLNTQNFNAYANFPQQNKQNLILKEYQSQALKVFTNWLRQIHETGSPAQAFKIIHANYAFENAPHYYDAPHITKGTPYVCLKIPTGGGKTLLAAHCINIATTEFLRQDNPFILWLVPSDAILQQTLNALKNSNHPYYQVLQQQFGLNFSVIDRDEALCLNHADALNNACILVSTIQAFRREKDNGKTNLDALKVYKDNSALDEHFMHLTSEQWIQLQPTEENKENKHIRSLANLLRLVKPMVIIDEAHNARTPLSFATLERFSPSLILELTATPITEHDPQKNKHASNILYQVSATSLACANMIKMPIMLTTINNPLTTLNAAIKQRDFLTIKAEEERQKTGEYIRPIVLIQAQSFSKNDPNRLTYDKIEEHLIEAFNIPKRHIAVHSGTRNDLDNYPNILDERCEIRYIITVQKLKEGWDCPFAYILCSLHEQNSAIAIEQILGRILRKPNTTHKRIQELNNAYAFITSTSFTEVAATIINGLVLLGYKKIEAQKSTIQNNFNDQFNEEEIHKIHINASPEHIFTMQQAVTSLPPALKLDLRFNPANNILQYKGVLTEEKRNLLKQNLAQTLQNHQADQNASVILLDAINEIGLKSNSIYSPMLIEQGRLKEPFKIPLMAFRTQHSLELFSEHHFLGDKVWKIADCLVNNITQYFKINDKIDKGLIRVTAQDELASKLLVSQNHNEQIATNLTLTGLEFEQTLNNLVYFLDNALSNQVDRSRVEPPNSRKFITNILNFLIERQKYSLEQLFAHKYELQTAIRKLFEQLKSQRAEEAYQNLLEYKKDSFVTSHELSLVFNEQHYEYNNLYDGYHQFNKHYFLNLGDLKDKGEEFECACYLDKQPQIKHWLRNTERKKTSFFLQLSKGKFYPDFIAELEDGRYLIVEYKGEHLYSNCESKEKRQAGYFYAKQSNGLCLFCMPTEKDLDLIDRTINSK